MIVNTGLAMVGARLRAVGTEPIWLHWGTGTTAPAGTDAALQTPRAEARVSGVSSQATNTTANDTYRVVGTITAATAGAITEVGLFDAATAGSMFFRAVFPVNNVEAGGGIQFTVNTVFARG